MKKVIIFMVLAVFTLVIFLPPIVYGYVYPNNGDDAAYHLQRIEAIRDGGFVNTGYWGDVMVGYPMLWFNEQTNVSLDAMFMWFNFVVLWLVGVSVYVLFSSVVGWQGGLLAMPLVVFGNPSTLNLFDFGGVFDLATVGVVLPLLLFCVLRIVRNRKWTLIIVPTVILAVLAVVLHTMGIVPFRISDFSEPVVPISEFVSVLFGFAATALLLTLVVALFTLRKAIRMNHQEKTLLIALGGLVLLFVPCTFVELTSFSVRFGIDLAIILAMFTACLLGIILKTKGAKSWVTVVVVLLAVGTMPLMVAYSGYNSAIRVADREAIDYANTLNYEVYNCSPEVAFWIYNRFTDAKYSQSADGLLITRNSPMTPRSDPRSGWYKSHGISTDGYTLDREFDDNKVSVKIYVKE